jgi:hypothetical protein
MADQLSQAELSRKALALKRASEPGAESARLPAWIPPWLREALSRPTMSVPLAGKALGIESRNGSYDAAKRGDIPTLKFGRLRPVPTAWVRRQLMLDDEPPKAA